MALVALVLRPPLAIIKYMGLEIDMLYFMHFMSNYTYVYKGIYVYIYICFV